MYEHTPSDPQKRRHETIRSIYLWNVPAEKRADKPRENAKRQSNFETKYRHVIKDRADHEWSRKYYYPPADTKPTESTHSGLVERLLAKNREELAAYVPPSRAKKEAAAAAASSPRSYTSPRDTVQESPRERQRASRTESNHPAVEASRSSRRLNHYLELSEDKKTSTTSRYDRSSRRSTTTVDDSVASSSGATTSSGRSYERRERSKPEETNDTEASVATKEEKLSRSSSVSSKHSSPVKDDSSDDDMDEAEVNALIAEVMAKHGDSSDSEDEEPSHLTEASTAVEITASE